MTGARGFFRYLPVRWRLALGLLPALLVSAAALLAAGALFLRAGLGDGSENRRLRVAVAGAQDDRVLRTGLSLLEQMDQSRYFLELETMEAPAAREKLERGELDAVLEVPPDFVQKLREGAPDAGLTLYVPASAAALSVGLTREIGSMAAALLSEAERSVYALQEYVAENLPDRSAYAAGDALAADYLGLLLDRENLFTVETVGLSGGLGTLEYCLCALTVLFPLFFGLAAAPLAGARSDGLNRMLAAAGLSAFRQCAAEWLAWLGVLIPACLLLWAGGAGLASRVPALAAVLPDGEAALRYALRALLPVCVLAALQLLLLEAAAGPLDGLLLELLAAAVLGFLGGCFYPASFFPSPLRELSQALPTGAALFWVGGPGWTNGLILLTYLALALAGMTLLRRRRLEGGGA